MIQNLHESPYAKKSSISRRRLRIHDFKSNKWVAIPLMTNTNFDFLHSPSMEFTSLFLVRSSWSTGSRNVFTRKLKAVISCLSNLVRMVLLSAVRSVKSDLWKSINFITCREHVSISDLSSLKSACLSCNVGWASLPQRSISPCLAVIRVGNKAGNTHISQDGGKYWEIRLILNLQI